MRQTTFVTILTALLAGCAMSVGGIAENETKPSNLLIVGQDLGAIRGYVESGCCPKPDGLTAYVDFYDMLSESGGFGGLGLNAAGEPVDLESDWGGGPANALKTALSFGVDNIAIGLSLTENEHPGALDRLVAGQYDDHIRQLAHFAQKVRGRIYLRIGYEFDGFWNLGYADAERYVEAYRRIVEGIREQNTQNVEYVWQGAASTTDVVLDGGSMDNIEDWYPGDDYVDWVGLSWFMHPDAQPKVELTFPVPTPRQLADELVDFARAHEKPVMIAEASPQGFDLRDRRRSNHSPIWDGAAGKDTRGVSDQEIWERWFEPLFVYIQDNADVIRALAYINVRWDEQDLWDPPYESGYWGDTRLEVNEYLSRRFTARVNQWRRD